MPNLVERFANQVNTLIPFLGLSRPEIFEVISEHEKEWFTFEQFQEIPSAYPTYALQINHAAFLLGYSYFEAFLADLAREIYLKRPSMLPKSKKLDFDEILSCQDYASVLNYMVEKEVLSVFSSSMADVIKYLGERFNITCDTELSKFAIEASLIRNCLMHNNSCADARLAKHGEWRVGELIILDNQRVNDFGTGVRTLALIIYEQADNLHLRPKRHRNQDIES